MQERTVNISFSLKENILLSLKETKNEILYLSQGNRMNFVFKVISNR
jgi:hypothetical protein